MNKLKEEVTCLKIAAIAGSNANHSYNRMLLEFMAQHFKDQDQIDVIDIRQVPMFNESFKGDAPEVIKDIDRRIKDADAVIIASPEYNHSITSALKSIVEWLSYSVHPLTGKPVMTIGACMIREHHGPRFNCVIFWFPQGLMQTSTKVTNFSWVMLPVWWTKKETLLIREQLAS